MADTQTITDYLNRELDIQRFNDSSHNGLQVANSGRVTRICCGVDASLEFFEEAASLGADFLICHHGISWGSSLARIDGLNYARVRYLMEKDMALYACHLPLDAHPVLGNNACIARALGLQKLKPFGIYGGSTIGFSGQLPSAVRYETFKKKVLSAVGGEPNGRRLQTMDFGKRTVRHVAVISGGAADAVAEAAEAGMDVFLTGEPKLSAYSEAQEHGINVIFAGHYATETFGVQALGAMLKKRFRIPASFVELKIGF